MNSTSRAPIRIRGPNFKRFAFYAFALPVVQIFVTGASAASVTFILDTTVDNQWKVFADVSDNDNFGIASYSFKLTGNTLTHDNATPRTTAPTSGTGDPAGFTLLRSQDNTNAATVESNINVSASQDTVLVPNPHLVYGFGQETSSFVLEGITPGGMIEQPLWSEPLLLAQGTYNRALNPTLNFDWASALTWVNVFTEADNPNDDVNPPVGGIPNANESFIVIPFTSVPPPVVVDAVIGPPYNTNRPGHPQTLTHQFQMIDADTPTGPFAWDMLELLSFTPNYGNTRRFGPRIAPTLSNSGLFTWISEGSPRGDYVWRVRGTDPGGASDFGTISVHAAFVPEPSTLALCCVAIVGFRARARRI